MSYVYSRDQHGSDRSYAAYPNGFQISPTAFHAGAGPAPLVAAPACGTVHVPTGQGYGGEFGGQYTAYAGNGPMAGNFGLYQHHAAGFSGQHGPWGAYGNYGGSSYPGTYGELASIGYGSLVGRAENYGMISIPFHSHYSFIVASDPTLTSVFPLHSISCTIQASILITVWVHMVMRTVTVVVMADILMILLVRMYEQRISILDLHKQIHWV